MVSIRQINSPYHTNFSKSIPSSSVDTQIPLAGKVALATVTSRGKGGTTRTLVHRHACTLPNPEALGPDIEEGAVNQPTDSPLAFPWPRIELVRIRKINSPYHISFSKSIPSISVDTQIPLAGKVALSTCDGCGKKLSIEHALSCPKIGLVLVWHNDAAKEWGALGARSLVPSAITYVSKFN